MKVIVTGASGFVGSHLAKELGDDCKQISRNDLIEIDSKMFDGYEYIIHCAGQAEENGKTKKDTERILFESNVNLTKRLAQAAIKSNIKKFIFISTLKVHGESSHSKPFKYNDSHNPSSSYAKSKSEAEKVIISLTKNTKMDYVIIRPPIIYGEGSRSNFTKLIDLIKVLPILPFSKLHNRRSFVSIYNLVDLIKKCLISDKSSNKSFLVSDNHDLSTLELARMIAKIIKKNIVFLPIPPSILKIMFTLIGKGKISEKIIESLESDISYTMSELDWKPSLSVMEGLKKTLKT